MTWDARAPRLTRNWKPKPCPHCGQPGGLCEAWKRRLHEIMASAGSGRRGYTIRGTQGSQHEFEEDDD